MGKGGVGETPPRPSTWKKTMKTEIKNIIGATVCATIGAGLIAASFGVLMIAGTPGLWETAPGVEIVRGMVGIFAIAAVSLGGFLIVASVMQAREDVARLRG